MVERRNLRGVDAEEGNGEGGAGGDGGGELPGGGRDGGGRIGGGVGRRGATGEKAGEETGEAEGEEGCKAACGAGCEGHKRLRACWRGTCLEASGPPRDQGGSPPSGHGVYRLGWGELYGEGLWLVRALVKLGVAAAK